MRVRLAWGRSRVRCTGPATFFRGDWSWNHFDGHFLPTADSSRTAVSYWRMDVHLVLVNRLGSLPRNSVIRLTGRLDMTIVVDWDVKPQIKQMSQLMRLWYLSYRRPAKAQASLRIRAVSPEPSLFAHMKYGSRWRVRPNIRHLAPLDGCACAFEEWVNGGRKVP